jgi:hypothetical protein
VPPSLSTMLLVEEKEKNQTRGDDAFWVYRHHFLYGCAKCYELSTFFFYILIHFIPQYLFHGFISSILLYVKLSSQIKKNHANITQLFLLLFISSLFCVPSQSECV